MEEEGRYLGRDDTGGDVFEIEYGPNRKKVIVRTQSISDLLEPIKII